MVKFQDYINFLGLRDKLMELDRRMEKQISDAYESRISEVKVTGKLMDYGFEDGKYYYEALQYYNDTSEMNLSKADVVKKAKSIVYDCFLDIVSGIRLVTLLPYDKTVGTIISYCLGGFVPYTRKDFKYKTLVNLEIATVWEFHEEELTGAIADLYNFLSDVSSKQVGFWVLDYLKEYPTRCFDKTYNTVDIRAGWLTYHNYLLYFLMYYVVASSLLGKGKGYYTFSTNHLCEHYAYQFITENLAPQLGAEIFQIGMELDDSDYVGCFKDTGMDASSGCFITKKSLNLRVDDLSEEYKSLEAQGVMYSETYLVMLGFSSRKEALQYIREHELSKLAE